MKATPFVVMLAVATIALGAQQPTTDNTIVVQIVIVTADDLKKECTQAPTTVVVIGTQAYHCIGKKLISHAEEGNNPALDAAIVRVSVGQRIQWQAAVPFTVTRIERHAPLANGTPNGPFSGDEFSNKPSKVVRSGTVVNLEGNVQQRYKASFQIEGVGLVDPDFVCSM